MIDKTSISRRSAMALGAGAAAAVVSGPQIAAASTKMPVVVELYTSQGCSSCPPADAFMEELIKRPGVIAASFNVDYWDYIGWRDTLASPAYSRRQRDYALRRGDRQVYTPQMVINGRTHAVGSRKRDVDAAIQAEAHRIAKVPIKMTDAPAEVTVEVGGLAGGKDSTLWLMMLQPSIAVPISRGENTGRKITYFNVVRKFIPVGMWHGKALKASLPKAELFSDGATACAAILQEGGVGPIIAATYMGPNSA